MKFFSFWRSLASFRVRIALNLKGLSADEVIDIDLMRHRQREEAFRKINPQMMIPALVDDDGAVLFQSMAIMEYLDDIHPQPPLLPSDAAARARVRGLCGIVVADAHPLIVPRVRNYLESELKIDEPARLKWIHHWLGEAMQALEAHLAGDATGRFCQGDSITLADICLVSHAVGCDFFNYDRGAYPIAARIVETCLQNEAFAAAHPLRQPGGPGA